MIDPKQIPDEVERAFGDAWIRSKSVKECLAAALNAWPKMEDVDPMACGPNIILPLPKEGK